MIHYYYYYILLFNGEEKKEEKEEEDGRIIKRVVGIQLSFSGPYSPLPKVYPDTQYIPRP